MIRRSDRYEDQWIHGLSLNALQLDLVVAADAVVGVVVGSNLSPAWNSNVPASVARDDKRDEQRVNT